MSTGLLALLDDVAALVKASAASLDDIPTQIAKTTSKVSGIVIDDAAVTPKYVVGLDPARELAIIGNIARQSLINKLLYLSPFIVLLNWIAPWALAPLLMCGGGYLCLEGYEKVHSLFMPHNSHPNKEAVVVITPEELEQYRIKSAVTTDFILSAEIVAITYSTIINEPLINQIAVLLSVGLIITVAVYGFVALVVKVDDIGLHLATTSPNAGIQSLGKRLISIMPGFLKVLGYIGTAAMLWVGGEIIIHGIPQAHHALVEVEHSIVSPSLGWGVKALLCGITGLFIGYILAYLVTFIKTITGRPTSSTK